MSVSIEIKTGNASFCGDVPAALSEVDSIIRGALSAMLASGAAVQCIPLRDQNGNRVGAMHVDLSGNFPDQDNT